VYSKFSYSNEFSTYLIKHTDQDSPICTIDNLNGALDVNGKNAVTKLDKARGAATVLFDGSYPVRVHYFS